VRKILLYILRRSLLWIAYPWSSAPQKTIVFKSLSGLFTTAEDDIDQKVKLIEAVAIDANFIIYVRQIKWYKETKAICSKYRKKKYWKIY
jgi:hypothetical protein